MEQNNSTNRFSQWPVLNCVLILLGCVIAFGVFEIGLRLFWRPTLASWQKNLNMIIPLDSTVVRGVAGPVRIITNSRGIRGSEWSADRTREYRILAIGGSTTECYAQDQPNTWPALLQQDLPRTANGKRVWVGNVGHGGHTSRHHVVAMRYMLDQYHPDAVVILMGLNDFAQYFMQGAGYDPQFIGDEEKVLELAKDFRNYPLQKNSSGWSIRATYSWKYLGRIYRQFAAEKVSRGSEQNFKWYRDEQEKRRHAWLVADEMPVLQPGLDGYRRNILELIRMARTHRVHLVFMTQPALYKPVMPQNELDLLWLIWLGPRSLNAYWSPRVMAKTLDEYNQMLLSTCRDEHIDCVDVASRLPKTIAVFWDHAHFTDYGSRLVADELIGYFSRYFKTGGR
jgi:hypothetical protein